MTPFRVKFSLLGSFSFSSTFKPLKTYASKAVSDVEDFVLDWKIFYFILCKLSTW